MQPGLATGRTPCPMWVGGRIQAFEPGRGLATRPDAGEVTQGVCQSGELYIALENWLAKLLRNSHLRFCENCAPRADSKRSDQPPNLCCVLQQGVWDSAAAREGYLRQPRSKKLVSMRPATNV